MATQRRHLALALLTVGMLGLTLTASQSSDSRSLPPNDPLVCTFSIVGHDPKTNEWGIAVASKYLAVGSAVPFAQAKVGAIATQSYVNVLYGPQGLELLQKHSAEETIQKLTEPDKGRDFRQLGIVDSQGRAAQFTGPRCMPWAGGKLGTHFACQGNLLAGPEVVDAMASAFEATQGPLAWRLMAALEAGDAKGGDKRGKQSAAILVVAPNRGPNGMSDRYLDFRVDDAKEPIPELARILALRLPRPKPMPNAEKP
ncbi:DUF1028 domain-containing protein [Tuwongella immobilis]|uniref:Peptidoglycan binding domain-containing protein n=1 Tax=Tuwongella immobilis TaxID=692036 RepID=A0A6C2YS86_9BACT|nr:DUF1028 domain-containing protein [Tuwongella immobilis]VIP04530.1 Uncharacterized protein OS=Geobacillus kaustophilus GBlys GN=GBL_2301 PE=4 SV=1: DUF1028 [Tuwongella immobilis]VTS06421.1 Uncharacterized protein OS=Geobacillus kaustophilus GBlys GN=GBL_2301 PE=4 SV=1: DUF1028 [Tuwongella immobilis]